MTTTQPATITYAQFLAGSARLARVVAARPVDAASTSVALIVVGSPDEQILDVESILSNGEWVVRSRRTGQRYVSRCDRLNSTKYTLRLYGVTDPGSSVIDGVDAVMLTIGSRTVRRAYIWRSAFLRILDTE